MSNKKYDCRYVTSIPFEKAVFDEVNQLLPRGTDISDEINAFLKQRLGDLRQEKNEIAELIDQSAIKLPSYQYTIQTTLDKYVNPWILNWKDYENQNEIQSQMTYEEQIQTITALNHTVQHFKSRLYQ
jgi:hypothetical protein